MKPTALKKGDVVDIARRDGSVCRGEFLYRQAPELGKRNGDCRFVIPEYAGQDDMNDRGITVLTDTDVRRCVTLVRRAA
jgi:hypothetical protein